MSDNVIVLQASDEPEKPIAEEIRQVFRALADRRRLIAMTVLITMALVILYIWTTTPLYSARVEILIDPRQRQTVDSEIAPTGLGSSAAGADTLLLESQVEVLKSQKVIGELIRYEDLTADPEFAGSGSSELAELIKAIPKAVIYGPQESMWRKTSAYDKTMAKLRKRVSVERQRNTYVIGVTMQSKDPAKAAHMANRIAQIYISEVNAAASNTTIEAATALTSKLEELRRSANVAAEEVETYKRQNNLIGANKTLVVEQRLGDLNRSLSEARTEVQTALARRNQVRAAGVSGNAPALYEIGESAVMSELQSRMAAIESQIADLKIIYMESHPTLKRFDERKAALLESMRREYTRILNRLDVAYETALEKAQSLQAEVDRLESQMAASNSDTVQLRELQRLADTSRGVYESFLRRSKEAWEQIDIPNSTARIISPAYAASKPSHPRVFSLLAGGLAFSLVLGVVIALLNSVFGRHPAPAEAVRTAKPVRQAEPVRPVGPVGQMAAVPIERTAVAPVRRAPGSLLNRLR